MFQLLVSYDGWEDSGDTIPTGRIYIKPGVHPDEMVLTDGKLDVSKVNRVPAVLMAETDGRGPQTARLPLRTDKVIGRLLKVSMTAVGRTRHLKVFGSGRPIRKRQSPRNETASGRSSR